MSAVERLKVDMALAQLSGALQAVARMIRQDVRLSEGTREIYASPCERAQRVIDGLLKLQIEWPAAVVDFTGSGA